MNASAASNRELGEEWIRRFNTHDVPSLVELYAADARHTSPRIRELHPETGGFLVGHEALATWWTEAHGRTPGLHYEPVAIVADEQRVFIEYVRHAHGSPDSLVAERFEVTEDKISSSKVYLE